MRTRMMLVLALAAILAVGFGAAGNALAAEKTVKFKIPGCVWGDTATQVRITAQGIDGVKTVDSNAVNQSATITYDDTKTSVEAIRKTLARAGYPPVGKEEMLK